MKMDMDGNAHFENEIKLNRSKWKISNLRGQFENFIKLRGPKWKISNLMDQNENNHKIQESKV